MKRPKWWPWGRQPAEPASKEDDDWISELAASAGPIEETPPPLPPVEPPSTPPKEDS